MTQQNALIATLMLIAFSLKIIGGNIAHFEAQRTTVY